MISPCLPVIAFAGVTFYVGKFEERAFNDDDGFPAFAQIVVPPPVLLARDLRDGNSKRD